MKNISFGCQTIGSSLDKLQSFEILDYCLSQEINRFDLAERYPFPENQETIGLSEKIFGEWLKSQSDRASVQVSTKVSGRNDGALLGKDADRLTRDRIITSVNNSLRRLQTDYIDTFFLHWPDRYTNNFGRLFYNPEPDPFYISIESQFETLLYLKDIGKIKQYGLSNETPWGLMKFAHLSRSENWPLVYQTEYSVIDRSFEMNMLEICLRENIASECHSILCGGLLTNKYQLTNGAVSGVGRLITFPEKTKRHQSKNILTRYQRYLTLCSEYRLEPFSTAVHFALSRDFFNAVIVGASNISQLREVLSVSRFDLSSSSILDEFQNTLWANL